MPTNIVCEKTSARLEAAFWSRRAPSPADVTHVASCPSCGGEWEALKAVANSLATSVPPEFAEVRARSIRQVVAREFANSTPPIAVATRRLPIGYGRELARILGWALLPLPIALFAYLQLFQFGAALLGQVLPEWGVVAVGFVAASAAASWLAVVYGSIPLVAYQRLSGFDDAFKTPHEVST